MHNRLLVLVPITEYYCIGVMEGEGVIGTGNSGRHVSPTRESLSPHFELLGAGVRGVRRGGGVTAAGMRDALNCSEVRE